MSQPATHRERAAGRLAGPREKSDPPTSIVNVEVASLIYSCFKSCRARRAGFALRRSSFRRTSSTGWHRN